MKPGQFAARLRELRKQSGLTQPALAKLAGLSRGAIAQLEGGTREPTFATVQKLADALGLTCLDFAEPKKRK